MSKLFEIITDFIEITGNSTIDSVLLRVIGILSFMFAFSIVGIIFDAIGFYDFDLMSGFHWFFRILIFLIFSAICIGIAKFVAWFFSFQWWIYLLMFIIVVGIVFIACLLKHNYSKKKAIMKIKIEQTEENPIAIEREVENKRNICPRCGGLLVKRHGPYGDFYGCENFSTNDFRYTRKYK